MDNYIWLLLLAFVAPIRAANMTTSSTADNNAPSYARSNTSTILGDSELSASERNRRLIPYMAFYLPPPDFPINQQYAIQKPHKLHHHPHRNPSHHYAADGGELLQAPPPIRIPIPPAYMPAKHTASNTVPEYTPTSGVLGQHTPQQHQFQVNHPVDAYHAAIAYSGPTSPVLGLKNISPSLQQQQQQQQHFHTVVIPASTKAISEASFIAYKAQHPHKHKTVQHFPPLPSAQKQSHQQSHQQQHQEQQETVPLHIAPPVQSPVPVPPPPPPSPHPQPVPAFYQRQHAHAKQSKFNLTPFTAENTVPGQFVPIIYTPVSSNNHNNKNEHQNNGNTVNYNSNDDYNNKHNQNEPPTSLTIAIEEPAEVPQQQHSHGRQQGHVLPPHHAAQTSSQVHQSEYLASAAPALAAQPTANTIYHYDVFNEPSPQTYESDAHTTKRKPLQLRQKPTPSKHEQQQQQPFFNINAEPQLSYLSHAEQMTPQEEYVMYLQQRIRHQHKQQHDQRAKELYLQQQKEGHQQQTATYVGNGPPAPKIAIASGADVGGAEVTAAAPAKYIYPTYTVGSALHAEKQQQQQHAIAVELTRHQQQPQPQKEERQEQQVLHIPLRNIIENLNEHPHAYVKNELGSTSAQYIDYIIDEPKQSLEDEQKQVQHLGNNNPQHPHPPGKTAYILVTTSAPYTLATQMPSAPTAPAAATRPRPRPVLPYTQSVTPRPAILRQSPTLRLQPVKLISRPPPTHRPAAIATRDPTDITSKYIFATPKPVYKPNAHQIDAQTHHTGAVKLKPSFKYSSQYNEQNVENKINYEKPKQTTPADTDQLPDIRTSSLAEILHKLQASNHLPQTLTPDNIDNSIKTLILILQNLKETQSIVPNPPKEHVEQVSTAHVSQTDYDYVTTVSEDLEAPKQIISDAIPNKHPGPSTGRPGVDYPNYSEIPQTNFDCTEQRYKGFFGDPETNCQVWHYCDLNGGKASFLCPNGTIFSQIALTCDWWFNVKCSTTAQLYVLNERLYKYILPFTPKFPEDYSGPIVDKYLAMKFQEMEEKLKKAQLPTTLQEQQQQKQTIDDYVKSTFDTTANRIEQENLTATTTKAESIPKLGKHLSLNSQVGEQSSERNLLIDDEIDDISERGSYDNYQPSTPATNASTEDQPYLSLKPIVVSSTPEPDASEFEEDKLQSLRDTTKQQQKQTKPPIRETTKVSVEKLEVIEIKRDDKTGELMPIGKSTAIPTETDDDEEDAIDTSGSDNERQ